MTDVATTVHQEQLVKKTHPVRGILWGLMMGLGLSIVLVLTKVIPFALVPMLIVLVLGTAVGALWSIFGPARQPKDVPAEATSPVVDEAAAVDDTQPSAEVDTADL
jgi:hypothetical protein